MTVFQTRKMLWHKVPVASILAPLASGYFAVMEKDSLPDVVSGVELVTDVNTHVVDHIMAFQDSLEFNWKDHIKKCLYTFLCIEFGTFTTVPILPVLVHIQTFGTLLWRLVQ